MQPHWVSALAWPKEEAETLWCGEPKDLLLVGRMDGSLGLIEVLDNSSMHRTELEHCYRKDGRKRDHMLYQGTGFSSVVSRMAQSAHVLPQWLSWTSPGIVKTSRLLSATQTANC